MDALPTHKMATSKDPGAPILGAVPVVQIPMREAVAIHLVTSEEDMVQECSFWIGLMTKGSKSPASLLDVPEITAIFDQAAHSGVTESEPLMLSDSRFVPPRHVYLVPSPPRDFRENTNWIHQLSRAVASWRPSGVGLYLAPDLTQFDQSHKVLLSILRQLIVSSAIKRFFLYTGAHGVHSLLNGALRLKKELAADQNQPEILIFH